MEFIKDLFKIFTDSTNVKDKYRKITSLIILVLLLFFVYVFFDYIIDENGKISTVVLFVVFLLIKEAITQHDVLYSGDPQKNKYARAFQSNLPSKYLAETYKIDNDEALSLWFKEFNKWKDPSNLMHDSWILTLSRGFRCRMAYFIIISFRFIAIMSALLLLVILVLQKSQISFNVQAFDTYLTNHSNLTLPVAFTISCFLIYLIFLVINYPCQKKPRGCFLRFDEINNQNIHWLKENFTYDRKNGQSDNNNA